MDKKIALTGLKPSGILHVGNYIGAIKPMVEFSRKLARCQLFMANFHALNQFHDAKLLRKLTADAAATYIAIGYDYEKHLIYRQSDIPQVFELATILTAVTPKGLMDRSHAYKDSVAKELDVNMGLYTYPILMAADILIANADIVPVGGDQKQHIEFARDIAGYFNSAYGRTIKLPDIYNTAQTAMIAGLDGRKMSKSYDNVIPLMASEKETEKLVMKIITDSKQPAEPKDPETSTIFQIYRHFASDGEIMEMREAFVKGGMGYGDAKKLLAAALNKGLAGPRAKFNDLMSRPDDLEDILQDGARRTRVIAAQVLDKTRLAVGACKHF
ncbi:MAG: tryptophan--tRNA ligase [Alphaproteobacteria bacterium]|nr:tryptophan--tRNA ligase [Alphaproteobacteria bacterium]